MSIKILAGFIYIFAKSCQKQPEYRHLLPQKKPHIKTMIHYILLILNIILAQSLSAYIGM